MGTGFTLSRESNLRNDIYSSVFACLVWVTAQTGLIDGGGNGNLYQYLIVAVTADLSGRVRQSGYLSLTVIRSDGTQVPGWRHLHLQLAKNSTRRMKYVVNSVVLMLVFTCLPVAVSPLLASGTRFAL